LREKESRPVGRYRQLQTARATTYRPDWYLPPLKSVLVTMVLARDDRLVWVWAIGRLFYY
jgi:hypothetical protein